MTEIPEPIARAYQLLSNRDFVKEANDMLEEWQKGAVTEDTDFAERIAAAAVLEHAPLHRAIIDDLLRERRAEKATGAQESLI